MIDFTRSEIADFYATMLPALKQAGTEWRGPCPIHRGKGQNFSVNGGTGLSKCHSKCGKGFDVLSLYQELTGSDFPTAKAKVFAIIGRPAPQWEDRDIAATYDYQNAAGKVVYQSRAELRQDLLATEARWRRWLATRTWKCAGRALSSTAADES